MNMHLCRWTSPIGCHPNTTWVCPSTVKSGTRSKPAQRSVPPDPLLPLTVSRFHPCPSICCRRSVPSMTTTGIGHCTTLGWAASQTSSKSWCPSRPVSTTSESGQCGIAAVRFFSQLSRFCFPSSSGVHHKGKNCDPAQRVTQIQQLLAQNRQWLYPENLAVGGYPRPPARMPKPNGGWGDLRDHQLCMSFLLPESHHWPLSMLSPHNPSWPT